MFSRILMYVCLGSSAAMMLAFVVIWLHERNIRPIGEAVARFRRLPLLGRVVVVLFVAQMVAFGSGKNGGGNSPDGGSGGNSPRGVVDQGRGGGAGFDSGFTVDELAAGYAVWRVGTNETWSFDAPQGAAVVTQWAKRGGAEDWIGIAAADIVFAEDGTPAYMTSSGDVAVGDMLYSAFGCPVSVFPPDNGHLVPGAPVGSGVWRMPTYWGAFSCGWNGCLVERATNSPASAVLELTRDGDAVFYYDRSRSGSASTSCTASVSRCGAAVSVSLSPDVTSAAFYRIRPEDLEMQDRDGDGLATCDEVKIYHTDPGLADTDGDGLPDGLEVAGGSDPNVRSVSDEDVLERVAASATNEMYQTATVVETNSLVSTALWDGFAADLGSSATNVLFERTLSLGAVNGWQHFFLSSSPDGAGDWDLRGLELEWDDGFGSSGTVRASPAGDSLYLPLTNMSGSVTIRLRATDSSVRAAKPMYLLSYSPVVEFGGFVSVCSTNGEELALVAIRDAEHPLTVSIDRSGRPSSGPLSDGEMRLPGLDDIEASEGMLRFSGTADGGTLEILRTGQCSIPEAGLFDESSQQSSQNRTVMLLDPSVSFGSQHVYTSLYSVYDYAGDTYSLTNNYPIDGRCVWRSWLYDVTGAEECSCQPYVTSGADHLEAIATEMEQVGRTAFGYVYVYGQLVWQGSALHSAFAGSSDSAPSDADLLDVLGECSPCESGCEDGSCDAVDGPTLGSLRFRVSLGVPRLGQHSGFVSYCTEEPAIVSPLGFRMTARPDAQVSAATNGTTVTYSCADSRGRDVVVEGITSRVRLTVRTHATGALDSIWEIENVGGVASVIRVRHISRLGNVMSDNTFSCQDGVWSSQDNIAGVCETVSRVDGLNDPESGLLVETRTLCDSSSNVVKTTVVESSLVGIGANAVLRQTRWTETTACASRWRAATYWDDAAHSARHGRPRLVWGNCLDWTYRDYDGNGFETLLVEQRNGSRVPDSFPSVSNGILSGIEGLEDAFVTVSDYTPFSGDDSDEQDAGRVRCETRYVVRAGVAACIGRKWHRYTHLTHGGMPAVKQETWRAAGPSAVRVDASNAYSWKVSLSESAQGVPLVLRGCVADSLDEDGVRCVHAYTTAGGIVRDEARRSYASNAFPTYQVSERDATYGNTLREALYLTGGDVLVDETISVYDDKNRLRSRSFSDGTSMTNAYSCCRLLWSEDRLGRRKLRSAVTGLDGMYYAEEDVWLADVSTNGMHRVTQHFMDGFGRETNVVVYAGSVPGEATNFMSSAGCESSVASVSYPFGGSDWSETTDARGLRTVVVSYDYADRSESQELVYAAGSEECSVATRTTRVRGGATCVERSWDGKWRREMLVDDFDDGCCRVEYEIVESSDCGVVTNKVTHSDFLGRTVLVETPLGNTSTSYLGASGRADAATFAAGGVSRVASAVYDQLGERVGTVRDGVTEAKEVFYMADGDGTWWRVERKIVSGSSTNSVSETRTRIDGLGGEGPVSHVVSVAADGVVNDVREYCDPVSGQRVTVASNSVSGVSTRTSFGGLPLATSGSDGGRELSYDAFGRNVLVSRPGGAKVSSCDYDAVGDLIASHTYTNADSFASRRFGHDSFGRCVWAVDELGGAVTTRYDAVGNIVERSGDALPVRCTYDTAGRRTSLSTTRNGILSDMTSWSYDLSTGRCTSKRYADDSQTAYSHAADGLVCAEANPSGSWVNYAYDDARRLSSVASSDGKADAAFAYDEFGRFSSVSNQTALYSYSRSSGGAATNECVAVGTNTATYVRVLDQYGRVCGRGFEGGFWQTIEYDGRGRVAAVSNDVACAVYSYSAEGQDTGCSVIFAGGATIARQVTRDAFRPELVVAVTNLVNGVVVDVHEYSYDAAGRVSSCNGGAFGHDARGQLTSAVVCENGTPLATYAYAYDQAGNMVSLSGPSNTSYCTVNSLNQCDSFGGQEIQFDQDGCMRGTGDRSLWYDSALRLDSVTTGGVQALSFAYDAFGRRVVKTAGADSTVFMFDGLSLAREIQTSDGACVGVSDYFWGRDASGALGDAGGVGGLVCVVLNGVAYAPLYDGFGNVTAYVDSSGSVVARYSYGPFGETLSASGPMSGAFRFRFSTKYHDADTGLVHYECRCYSPAHARWTTRDPLGEEGGENLYAFCGNDPVGRFDALGMFVVIPPNVYEPVGTWISVADLYFRATMNWEFAATLLELSLKDFDGSLPVVFGEGSVAAMEIRDSEEYKSDVRRLLRSLPAGRSFVHATSSVEFLSGDLYAAAKRAKIEYKGYVCRPIAGADRAALDVTVSDTYDFEWWDISDTGKELSMEAILTTTGNNMAYLDQIRGVIKPFDWEVKFRETGRWPR